MRALVVATDPPTVVAAVGISLPVLDRSLVQHLVEYVLDQGVQQIDFALPPGFESSTRLLGTGLRWGGHFNHYSVPDGSWPIDVLRPVLSASGEEKILIAYADNFFLAPIRVAAAASHNTMFYWRESGRLVWTGWGVVRAAMLTFIPPGIGGQHLAGRICALREDTRIVEVSQPLSVGCYADVIESNRRALSGEYPDMLRRGKEVRPGLWVGRNVRIHPTARLVPPAFVGDNSRLGAGVQVGPSAVIGRDCVIGRNTLVSNSVIGDGSYVGEELDLKSVFVDRSKLINTRLNAAIDGVDERLLGSVSGSSGGYLRMACEALLATLVLLSALPLLAFLAVLSRLACGPALHKKAVVRTPAVAEPFRWSTFDIWYFGNESRFGRFGSLFLFALPALIHVAFGRLALVGPRPLSMEEIKELPDGKRLRHLQLRSGLLQAGIPWGGARRQPRHAAETSQRARQPSRRPFVGVFRRMSGK